jgi:hypothetical protein
MNPASAIYQSNRKFSDAEFEIENDLKLFLKVNASRNKAS